MSGKRRMIYCLLAFIVLVSTLLVGATERLPLGGMIVAPASLDGKVTISTLPDRTRIFVTYAPDHPSLLRQLLHSSITGAFVVQQREPLRNAVAHAGNAHVDFGGDLLNIEFPDASFIFTVKPEGSLPAGPANVDYVTGLATFHVSRISTHTGFVASRDWKQNSCGLK